MYGMHRIGNVLSCEYGVIFVAMDDWFIQRMFFSKKLMIRIAIFARFKPILFYPVVYKLSTLTDKISKTHNIDLFIGIGAFSVIHLK